MCSKMVIGVFNDQMQFVRWLHLFFLQMQTILLKQTKSMDLIGFAACLQNRTFTV